MGVKDLWTILAPFCERKPLYELQGKKVAIDLSCWVCESQNVTDYTIHPRMYLRNLYFRTCYLLLMDVNVVFVLEGRAPELKYKTIAARNALQFKGQAPKTDKTKCKDRSRFNHTLKLCEDMLKLMGIACVQGEGEAEALCAHLNEDQLVDGIISQDSDCFAYGAKTVFRNFSISQQGKQAAKGGSIDVYSIEKVEENLNFGRNKIIALALLCGSDYCEGVHGVGKDSAMKWFNTLKDDEVLPRLQMWKNEDIFKKLENKILDKNLCTSCGHSGKVQSHTKSGCFQCSTNKGCDSSKFKEERLLIKNELNMRSKALINQNFPDQTLIDEFIKKKEKIDTLNLEWKKPNFKGFMNFAEKYLQWEEVYIFEKFLPILTRWQLLHITQITEKTSGVVYPKFIKKKRNPKGVPSYEIIWEDKNSEFKNLVPPEQLESLDLDKFWATIEPQNLVEAAYPKLVEDFENSKKPKTRKKKKPEVNELSDLMGSISLKSPIKKKCKKIQKNTLDLFLQKVSTPRKNSEFSFSLDQSNFGDENDLDVSDIVDEITSRKLPTFIPANIPETTVECSFFNEIVEHDLFEKTLQCFSDDEND